MKTRGMKQVLTLSDLDDAANNRKAVVCPNTFVWINPRPAAFIISMQARIVLRLIRTGMFVYEKREGGAE